MEGRYHHMIHTLQSPLEVNQILEMARDVVGAPIEVLEKKLLQGMIHENSNILVDTEKDGEMRGFIFATVEELDGDKAVFIHLCVVKPQNDPKKNEFNNRVNRQVLSHELLNRIEVWAKELGMKNMYFMTKRNPQVWERAFKFKLDYYLLKRVVK